MTTSAPPLVLPDFSAMRVQAQQAMHTFAGQRAVAPTPPVVQQAQAAAAPAASAYTPHLMAQIKASLAGSFPAGSQANAAMGAAVAAKRAGADWQSIVDKAFPGGDKPHPLRGIAMGVIQVQDAPAHPNFAIINEVLTASPGAAAATAIPQPGAADMPTFAMVRAAAEMADRAQSATALARDDVKALTERFAKNEAMYVEALTRVSAELAAMRAQNEALRAEFPTLVAQMFDHVLQDIFTAPATAAPQPTSSAPAVDSTTPDADAAGRGV